MEIKFDVTPTELKRLMGNCSTEKEIVVRLIKALEENESYQFINDLSNEIVGYVVNSITAEGNERGFSIRGTANYYTSNVKCCEMSTDNLERLVKGIQDRLIGMNLIVKHPECDKVQDNDLWRFGAEQPAIFKGAANYHFARTFSQFK